MTPLGGGRRFQTRHRLKTQVLDHHIGCQRNEHRIDDEQVHRSEEIVEPQAGKAVAGRAQRRHQSGGDGNAGNGGSLLPPAVLQDAGQTAEKGDEHIIDGRTGPGFQLRGIDQVQRRDQEKECRCRQGDKDHHQQVLESELEQVQVIGPHRQSQTDDRSHQGGDEHSADDDRRGVHIESHGSDDDGKSKNPYIRPPEPDSVLDPPGSAVGIDMVVDIGVVPEGPSQVILVPAHKSVRFVRPKIAKNVGFHYICIRNGLL